MNSSKHTELANHAWSVADLLRGDHRQSDCRPNGSVRTWTFMP
ncbi:hypothetical protein ACIBRY_05940 [Streptomyces anulatus]